MNNKFFDQIVQLAVIILVGYLILTTFIASQKLTIQQYIEKYKALAITEMERTDIPASITLAQGILESEFGNSLLATKGKNHFGIKCHNTWKGKTMYLDDDAKDECFRKYNNVHDSFIDHSEFLKKRRYAALFSLDKHDYKGWARGLKKAGYATNPKYADLLIRLIEQHELHQYDYVGGKCSLVDEPVIAKSLKPEEFYYNRIKTILFSCDVTPKQVADLYKIKLSRLLNYNDFRAENQVIASNTKIYLQPKRSRSSYKTKYHMVRAGENMHSISQLYGIKLKRLYKRNCMKEGWEPVAGEQIYLRGKRRTCPQVITTDEANRQSTTINKPVTMPQPVQPAPTPTKKPVVAPPPAPKPVNNLPSIQPKPKVTPQPAPTTPPNNNQRQQNTIPVIYKVKAGDTLFSIAKRFDMTVEGLKAINGLEGNTLSIGQQLQIVRGR